MRIAKALFGLALGWAVSCAYAQAPSPADVGIVKGTTDTFKLKDSSNSWVPFGTSTGHVFTPVGGGGGGSPLSVTDGTHTVTGTTTLHFSGATVSGSTPNATATITGGGGSIVGGTTPITGTCPNGQFIYNNTGVVGCATVSGAGAAPFTLYPTHALLLAGITTPSGSASTVAQQGFYASGDGGEATYQWNATAFCLGGAFSSGAPVQVPADGLSCILPTGQSSGTAGRYLLNIQAGVLNARAFGLQPGVGTAFDNSPLLPAIFAAINGISFGPNGIDIIFTPDLGRVYTNYYFSQPFEITNGSSVKCSNSSKVAAGALIGSKVVLVFPGGVSGVIQENPRLSTSGGGDTGSTVIGCSVESLGRFSTKTHGSTVTGSAVITTVGSDAPAGWTGTTQAFAAGDGFIGVGPGAYKDAPLVAPGAYVGSVAATSGTQTVTLASPYVVGPQTPYPGGPTYDYAFIWRLPASEMRRVTTTTGSASAVITGGNCPAKVGDWVWSEAFLFGSMVMTESNQVASATVNSGGSGYTGSSGTMTWAGNGCIWGTNPVLNVTASGGVITGVSSVATAGNCNGAFPPNTAATWTPGGGLSGGSGATFNLSFANNVTMSTVAGSSNPSPAVKTGTYNLWTIPAGIMRRAGSSTQGTTISGFPVGLENFGDAGSLLGTGTANSNDAGDTIGNSMVGRYVVGADCSPSISMNNIYGENMLSDIVESCTLSNVYLMENTNSPENDGARFSILALCGTFNNSVVIGGYISGNASSHGLCMGTDSNGSDNIGIEPESDEIQGELLALGTLLPSTASLYGRGDSLGSFRHLGVTHNTVKATVPTAVSGTSISVSNLLSMVAVGDTVTDLTNPTAIPANTTVATITRGSFTVTISNPVASPGISVNDQIRFTQPAGSGSCIQLQAGINLDFTISYSCGGVVSQDFNITYNPDLQAYMINGNTVNATWFPANGYLGYNGGESLIAPQGIALGNTQSFTVGQERVLSMGVTTPNLDFHLQGDTNLSTFPAPGGTLATTDASSFNTTLSGTVTVGVTTSVAVAACPSPSLPAGTPIAVSAGVFGAQTHLGDLASCTSTTLTLQAAALKSATSGNRLDFLQWYPAALIANDTAGTHWTLGNFVTLSRVSISGLPSSPDPGTFAVVVNGLDAVTAGYNVTVAGTGSTTRIVFYDGIHWTYH